MSNNSIDWTTFTQRIYLKAPVEEIYLAWAIPARISTWFLEKAEYTEPGNLSHLATEPVKKGLKFRWKWHNWDFFEEGDILEANGKDLFAFTFGPNGNVKVSLNRHDETTELILTQYDIPDDEKGKKNSYVGCSTGWTFWLTNLKAWLEHGIRLNATGFSDGEAKNLVNS